MIWKSRKSQCVVSTNSSARWESKCPLTGRISLNWSVKALHNSQMISASKSKGRRKWWRKSLIFSWELSRTECWLMRGIWHTIWARNKHSDRISLHPIQSQWYASTRMRMIILSPGQITQLILWKYYRRRACRSFKTLIQKGKKFTLLVSYMVDSLESHFLGSKNNKECRLSYLAVAEATYSSSRRNMILTIGNGLDISNSDSKSGKSFR